MRPRLVSGSCLLSSSVIWSLKRGVSPRRYVGDLSWNRPARCRSEHMLAARVFTIPSPSEVSGICSPGSYLARSAKCLCADPPAGTPPQLDPATSISTWIMNTVLVDLATAMLMLLPPD